MGVLNKKLLIKSAHAGGSYSSFMKENRIKEDRVIIYAEKRKAISKER